MLHFHHAPGILSETHLLEHVEAIFGANSVFWWFIPVVFQKMLQVIFRMIHVTSCLLPVQEFEGTVM
jgi:hypothetical protein